MKKKPFIKSEEWYHGNGSELQIYVIYKVFPINPLSEKILLFYFDIHNTDIFIFRLRSNLNSH